MTRASHVNFPGSILKSILPNTAARPSPALVLRPRLNLAKYGDSIVDPVNENDYLIIDHKTDCGMAIVRANA
jgi:hypothetical protein